MSPSDAEALRILLTDLDWLRSLARALVPEADLAEDAAQEVWVAALERQPRDTSNPRAWLAQVARNAVRKARRGERRRRERLHEMQAETEGLGRQLGAEKELLARFEELQETLASDAQEASAALAKIERKLATKGVKSANVKALERFVKKHAGTKSAARAERMVQLASVRL